MAQSPNWDNQLRVSSINALGRGQKNKKLMDLLIELANNKENDREIRRACITLLTRFKDIKILDTLTNSLDDEYRFIRFWAIRGLIKLKDPKAIPSLIKGLGDPDEEIRKEVRSHLEILGNDAVPAMIQAFKEPEASKFLRFGVVGLLGRLNHPEALPFLLESLNDENDRIVTIALRGIGKQPDPKSIKPLIELYLRKPERRRLIEDALYRIGQNHSKLFVENIVSFFQEENQDIINLATVLFEKLPESYGYIEKFLQKADADEKIKNICKSILSKI
ncbi:MAG: HEAT repeat domain-containing protein [Promethearchaeota archaeon]